MAGWLGLLLGYGHIAGLRTLLAVDYLEFDLIALLEALVAFRVDGAVVNEHIRAAVVAANEAKAFRIIEPLYGSFMSHLLSSSGQSPTAPPRALVLSSRPSG
jgi:hypothetical protein